MLISVSILWYFKKHVEDPRAAVRTASAASTQSQRANAMESVSEWKRIGALVVVFLIVIVFWMAFHQNGSTLTYWADDNTEWDVSGTISNAINPFWIITLTFPLVWFWKQLDKRGKEPSTPTKMVFGMLLTALSFTVLYFAARTGEGMEVRPDMYASGNFRINDRAIDNLRADGVPGEVLASLGALDSEGKFIVKSKKFATDDKGSGEQKFMSAVRQAVGPGADAHMAAIQRRALLFRVSPFWLILSYMIISLGELMLSPMGLSLVSKVAPFRFRGVMMGGWFVATAIGNKLTAIGVFWGIWKQSTFFIVLGAMAFVMALVLLVILRPLKKAMPGV
jgi:POT family proton-dependent oligopeptide transporter